MVGSTSCYFLFPEPVFTLECESYRSSTLGPDGSWPDIDYTTGCAAQRANWPAEGHWDRICKFNQWHILSATYCDLIIVPMSAAWHGGLSDDQTFVGDPALRTTISSAMGYWFGRDFTNIACLSFGGTPSCPCTNLDNSLWSVFLFHNLHVKLRQR